MGTKVTVNSTPGYRVSINNQRETVVRTVKVGADGADGANSITLLSDVDATDLDNNETLVYDSANSVFVVKTLPIVYGGEF